MCVIEVAETLQIQNSVVMKTPVSISSCWMCNGVGGRSCSVTSVKGEKNKTAKSRKAKCAAIGTAAGAGTGIAVGKNDSKSGVIGGVSRRRSRLSVWQTERQKERAKAKAITDAVNNFTHKINARLSGHLFFHFYGLVIIAGFFFCTHLIKLTILSCCSKRSIVW